MRTVCRLLEPQRQRRAHLDCLPPSVPVPSTRITVADLRAAAASTTARSLRAKGNAAPPRPAGQRHGIQVRGQRGHTDHGGMTWTLTEDLGEYLDAAGDFLRSRAAENTVLLNAAEIVRIRGSAAFGDTAPMFGWWQEPGQAITGAFLHTPPYGVALTAMTVEPAVALATALATRGRRPSGVTAVRGDRPDSDAGPAFAASREKQTGQAARLIMRSACTGWATCCRQTRPRAAAPGWRQPRTGVCWSAGSKPSTTRRDPTGR